jgi:hypothetical protein
MPAQFVVSIRTPPSLGVRRKRGPRRRGGLGARSSLEARLQRAEALGERVEASIGLFATQFQRELSEQRKRQERAVRFGLEQRLGTIEASHAKMMHLLSSLTGGAMVAPPSSSSSCSTSEVESDEESSSSGGEDIGGNVGGDAEAVGDTGGGAGGTGRRGRRGGRRPRASSWRVRRRRSGQMRR